MYLKCTMMHIELQISRNQNQLAYTTFSHKRDHILEILQTSLRSLFYSGIRICCS